MVIPEPTQPAIFFSLEERHEHADEELQELADRMRGKPIGWSTTSASGWPATVVNAETAHAAEVGKAELSRRERRAAARAARRRR